MPAIEIEPIDVALILTKGSRAGLAATIMNGYYMIGRHAECQIRPKTRSVSRRHCVVFRDDAKFKVLDLESTSGTKINHKPIPSRVWCDLEDGDLLSCGKICFQVSIKTKSRPLNHRKTGQAATAVGAGIGTAQYQHAADGRLAAIGQHATNDAADLVTGEAWQAFDVADFLESQDDADREVRYDRIRQSHAESLQRQIEEESGEYDRGRDSGDLDIYEDTPTETDEVTSTDLSGSARNTRSGEASLSSAFPPSSNNERPGDRRSEKTASIAAGRERSSIRPPKAGSSRRRMPKNLFLPRIRIASILAGDADRMKLIAAIVIAIIVMIVVVLQAFDLASGPPVRVIDDLD